MEETCALARDAMVESQKSAKKYFDRKAKDAIFGAWLQGVGAAAHCSQ